MTNRMIWLLLCGGYWIFIGAAEKRNHSAEAALCFLHGLYLAMLCFAILPSAMGTAAFYPSVAASALGVGGSFLLERKNREQAVFCALLFTGLTAVHFLCKGEIDGRKAIALAFFGGMGLYHACAGILPEGVQPREHIAEAMLSAVGFVLGTAFFAGFL